MELTKLAPVLDVLCGIFCLIMLQLFFEHMQVISMTQDLENLEKTL